MTTVADVSISPAGRARSDAPGRRGFGAVAWSFAAVLVAVVLYSIPGLSTALQYERSAIASGEVWRLVTCHWTHWSADHLLWDTAAFAVLAGACAMRSALRTSITLGVSALAIPLAVWVGLPELQMYRGLSGLASALLVLLMLDVMRETRGRGGPAAWACGALLLGFLAKVIYESVTGTCVFVDASAAGFVPVPLAHAVGAAVGAVVGGARFPNAGGACTTGIRVRTWFPVVQAPPAFEKP